MIVKNNIPIYSICWLNHAQGGMIGTFYEPETKDELIDICRFLYREKKSFDLIGHTSNIYFLPNYSVDIMVSTRKVKKVVYTKSSIVAECGASVKVLAHAMVNEGIKGFEGLVDLPGTVAASVYGNASCFNCSINSMLVTVEFLKDNGEIVNLKPEDLKIGRRSSSLKRGDLKGVILSVTLRKEFGDKEELKTLAEENHRKRKETQPGPKDNLGSIYSGNHKKTVYNIVIICLSKILCLVCNLFFLKRGSSRIKQKDIYFSLLGAKDLLPYVRSWNRYIWKDEKSHELFWKYHRIHKKLFNNMDFEIEIKGIK